MRSGVEREIIVVGRVSGCRNAGDPRCIIISKDVDTILRGGGKSSCVIAGHRIIYPRYDRSIDKAYTAAVILMIVDCGGVWGGSINVILFSLGTVSGLQYPISVSILARFHDAVIPFSGSIYILHVKFSVIVGVAAAIGHIEDPTLVLRNI